MPPKKVPKIMIPVVPTRVEDNAILPIGLHLVPIFFTVCDDQNREAIINFLFNDNTTPSVWFHNQSHYPMELFTKSQYLYYEYCNYKPYKPLFLKDKKFHQENATIVNRIRVTGNKKVEHSRGVQDHFYGFDSKYVSLEKHISFDPAHVVTIFHTNE